MSFEEVANESGLPPFSKKAEIAKAGERFCVTAVREVTKDLRKSWYLDILRTQGREQVAETMTFDVGSLKRDNKLSELQKDLLTKDVVHGVWIEAVRTKSGAPYFDPHYDADAFCLCGQVEEVADEEEAYA